MFPLQPDMTVTGTGWFSTKVLNFIRRESDSAAPRETGGILLGYWSESPVGPVIADALGPGPAAIHQRDRFIPDYEFHENEVARLYYNSKGALNYLGDWHSHPGNPGYLSSSDYATLCRIAVSRNARAPRPVMVILAFGPKWDPIVWSARVVRTFVRRKFMIERWNFKTFRP